MYVPGNAAYKHHIATFGPQATFGYKDFIPQFRAEKFNPQEWIELFAQAGARYVVPVAEHCDGFAMYASDITPWNAAQMGPHRDVVGELATATRARGLHFGVSSHTAEHWWWYGRGRSFPSDVRDESPLTAQLYGPAANMALPGPGESLDTLTGDATEPNPSHLELWLPPDKPFLDNWLARSTELIDKYHPDFLYFDWWIGQPAFKPALQQFAAYYYDQSAKSGHQPVLTYKQEDFPANGATLDIERGKLDTLRLLPWQTDTSISIHSWGYVEHDEYRTATSLIQQLLDAVAKNGNLLLNVGPKSDGTIPDEARTVLLQIGAWLKINGEAIYGSRPFTVFGEGPTIAPKDSTAKNRDIQTYTPDDIRYTTSNPASGDGRLLYASALGWPTSGSLTLHTLFAGNPYLPSPVCAVDLLGSPTPIAFRQSSDGLHLTLTKVPPSPLPPTSAYVFRLHTSCP
jgi:alpha-L-fucosidase